MSSNTDDWKLETERFGKERFQDTDLDDQKQQQHIEYWEELIRNQTIEGTRTNISVHETMHARATMQFDKAVDNVGLCTNALKALPFTCCITIAKLFTEYYQNKASTINESWRNTIYNGIPKESKSNKLDAYRWIAKLSLTRQWYNKTWSKHLRHTQGRTNARTYGFKAGHATQDAINFLREILKKCARWTDFQSIIIVVDILTAFDQITHHDSEYHEIG